MRLSEAIRLGSMLNPQGFGKYKNQRTGHTCALGAASEALGYHGVPSELDFPILSLQIDLASPPNIRTKPELSAWIIHWNDNLHMNREWIADEVEKIEKEYYTSLQPVAAVEEKEPELATAY